MESPLLGRAAELQLMDDVVFGRVDGVAFVGPAGCGKSALVDALEERSCEIGLVTHRIFGSPVTTGIDFGAIAHLAPDLDDDDKSGRLRAIQRRLASGVGARGGVLIVDDAEHLDPATIALVHALAVERHLRIVLTVTAGRTPTPLLYRVWKDGLIERCDVRPLDRADTRTLLERMIGGPVADDVERAIWDLTLGHPRDVTSIATHGTFREAAGLWRFDGDPIGAPEIAEIVEPSLEEVTPAARATLAAFAIGSPLTVDAADLIAGPEATAQLEQLQLVQGQDGLLSPTHPLVAHVALMQLSTRERRRIARTLADSLLTNPASAPSDLVRAVIWQIEAHAALDPEVAMQAAHQALSEGNYASARDIASATRNIVADEARWEAAFVLAQAHRQLGNISEAETAFVEAGMAANDVDRVNVTVAHAHNLAIAGGRFTDGLTMLSELSADIEDPDLRQRLSIERTFLSAVIGDFREVIGAAEELLAVPDVEEFTELSAATALTFALVMTLQVDRFDGVVDRLRPTAERLEGTYPLAVDQLDLITVCGRVAQGRVDDAITMCDRRRARGMDHSWGTGDGAWASMEAFARSFRADDEVVEVARRAVVGLGSRDPIGLRYVGTGISALAIAQCGMMDEARDMIASTSRPVSEGERRSQNLIQARLDAWAGAYDGDHAAAAEIVASTGRLAVEWGHLLWASLALHDAVRFGAPHLTRDDLHRLRSREHANGSLLDTMCDHADAFDERDDVALLRVSDEWLRVGASLFAAETAAQAASLLAERGDEPAAALAAGRAQVIGRGCLPPTPACSSIQAPLTERQSAIVLLLLDGWTAREVATELSVSTRTVENHVATVYRNLGVSNRQDLAAGLRPSTG